MSVVMEAWRDADGAITFTSPEQIAQMQIEGLVDKAAVRLYRIEADSEDAAMTEHHQRQGWEPYRPMEDA